MTAEIDDAGPFDAGSGEVAVGAIQDGTIATAPLELEVPQNVDAGEYEIEVEVEYDFTERVSDASGYQLDIRDPKRSR